MVRVAVRARSANHDVRAPRRQNAARGAGENRADERTETMPGVITPEGLASRIRLTFAAVPQDVDGLVEILRTALVETRSAAVAAAKTVCLEIAEDEAERCRGVGATAAQQTALMIAARIRKRHV
jgi:hypothetical protein